MSLIQLFILQFLRSTKLSKVKILNAVQSLYALVQLIPNKGKSSKNYDGDIYFYELPF